MIQQSKPIVVAALLAAAIAGTAHAQNLGPGPAPAADTTAGRTLEAPVDTRPVTDKFWWSTPWYDQGRLEVPVNHDVTRREFTYVNPRDKTEVPALLFRPKAAGRYPAVLFAHGRRGLDEWVERLAVRIAARGFVVLAPDLYQARFIERMPVAHQQATETDVAAGLAALLALPDVSTRRACLVSHTRGGYYTLRAAVTLGHQDKDVACYVSYYPHWQDPNASEPMQVYRYAPETGRLTVPTLLFIGEYEQYQRRRSIEEAVRSMKSAKRDVRLIIYPGVGRGFDFRPPNVRTFADDLATKDANLRTAAFMSRHLAAWPK
ncbi:MAG: dienelactone hydrolase family protein [Hyphomicrobiaceae bacterium]|nr:dienelactone hydrolase family protein [Hyphomicrobiaceae bacterium]